MNSDQNWRMLGQYELKEMLGRGGMGTVYRAYQRNLNRDVAIKVLPEQLAADGNYMERFVREAQTAASLEHPHIIPVYDYGTEGEITYVVMRLLSGGNLAERMKQRDEKGDAMPTLSEISQLLSKLGGALDYAHSRGVIHRDIKATNVMFDNHGTPFLVDFGIAKLMGAATNLTGEGVSMGTPAYMPPEQWKGDELTPSADQYALAVMVYSLITGQMPFEGGTPYALMHKHITEMPTPIHVYRKEVPPDVSVVLERALAKKPEERYDAVSAFAQAFQRAVEGVIEAHDRTEFFTFSIERQKLAAPTQTLSIESRMRQQRTPTPTPAYNYQDLGGATIQADTPVTIPPNTGQVATQVEAPPTTGGRKAMGWMIGAGIVGLIAVVALGVVFIFGNGGSTNDDNNNAVAAQTRTAGETSTAIALLPTETDTPTPSNTPTNTFTVTPSTTATNTFTSQEAALATFQYISTITATAEVQAQIEAQLTAFFYEAQTATATLWTPTHTPSHTPTLTPSNTPTNTATYTQTPSSTPTLDVTATATLSPLLGTPSRTETPPTIVALAQADIAEVGVVIVGNQSVYATLPADYAINFAGLDDVSAYAYELRFDIRGTADGAPYRNLFQGVLGLDRTAERLFLVFDGEGALAETFVTGADLGPENLPIYLGIVDGTAYAQLEMNGMASCIEAEPNTVEAIEGILLDLAVSHQEEFIGGTRDNTYVIVGEPSLKGIESQHYRLSDSPQNTFGERAENTQVDAWFTMDGAILISYNIQFWVTTETFSTFKADLVEFDERFGEMDSFAGNVEISMRLLGVNDEAAPYHVAPLGCTQTFGIK